MHIEENKFLAVFHGHAGNGVTAVQIEDLGKSRGNGQTAPKGRRDPRPTQRQEPAVGAAVRFRQGVHQIGRMVIDGKNFAAAVEIRRQHGPFIHVIAAGGIGIHFLKENEIRIVCPDISGNTVDAVFHGLFAFGPGAFASVHKESEIRRIGPESHILGHYRIFFIHRRRRQCGFAPGRQGLTVLNAVIRKKHIGHITENRKEDQTDNDEEDFQRLFHLILLFPAFLRSPPCPGERSRNWDLPAPGEPSFSARRRGLSVP